MEKKNLRPHLQICGRYYKTITIVNDTSRAVTMTIVSVLLIVASLMIIILMTLEVSFMLIELSIMLLENTYSTIIPSNLWA
jgi:hypothetical protein